MTQKMQPKPANPQPQFITLTNLVRVHAATITKILVPPPIAATTGGGCCCCCCCGSGGAAPAVDPTCTVNSFMVNQELRLDPNSFGVPGGPLIVGTQADISWNVTAPVDATVTVQARTRGLGGATGGAFADWTDQFNLQALIDSRRFNFNDVLGTRVEFRIAVLDSSGNTLCISAPDS